MKRLLSLSVVLFLALSSFGLDYTVITNQTAGSLYKVCDSNVTSLKVIGNINALDFKFLSALTYQKNLANLDLSDCRITKYVGKGAMSMGWNPDLLTYKIIPSVWANLNAIDTYEADEIPGLAFFDIRASTIKFENYNNENFRSKLKNIILPKKLKSIISTAFPNCEELTEITIPDSCKIYQLTFLSCQNLKKVVIGKGCKLDIQAFFANYALDSIILTDETPNILPVDVKDNLWYAKIYLPCGTRKAYDIASSGYYSSDVRTKFVDDCIKTFFMDTIRTIINTDDSIAITKKLTSTIQKIDTSKIKVVSSYSRSTISTKDKTIRTDLKKLSVDTTDSTTTLSIKKSVHDVIKQQIDSKIQIDSIFNINSIYETKYTIKTDTAHTVTDDKYTVVLQRINKYDYYEGECSYYNEYLFDSTITRYTIKTIELIPIKTIKETNTITGNVVVKYDTLISVLKRDIDSSAAKYKTVKKEIYRTIDTMLRVVLYKNYGTDSIVKLVSTHSFSYVMTSINYKTKQNIKNSRITKTYHETITDVNEIEKSNVILNGDILTVDSGGVTEVINQNGVILIRTTETTIDLDDVACSVLYVKTGNKIIKILKK